MTREMKEIIEEFDPMMGRATVEAKVLKRRRGSLDSGEMVDPGQHI